MIALLGSAAWATTWAAPPDLEALAAASDGAVYGVVTELRADSRDGMIWTLATVTPADGRPVQVRLLGGCLGEVCLTVPGAPRVRTSERVFVFLQGDQPTGFADGVFHVRDEAGWRETAALSTRYGGLPAAQAPLSWLLEIGAPLMDRVHP